MENKIVLSFSNIILSLILLLFLSASFYSVYKIFNTPYLVSNFFYKIIFFSSSICISLLLIILKKFNNDLKIIVSIISVSIIISFYSFEFYLEFIHKDHKTKYIEKNQIKFDLRSNQEVINDLSKKGIIAYPNIKPWMFRKTDGLKNKDGNKIFPVSGISNTTIVNCNESGFWSILKSDENGFLNPHGLISKKNLDVLLIGDSFAEGSCVNQKDTIAAKLREKNLSALTLGKSGNGPLLQLATLVEYGKILKPKSVFWLFYQNDIENLIIEKNSKILKNYLYKDFSQNLINRQDEIDEILKEYYENELINNKKKIKFNSSLFQILKLYNLRMMFNLIPKHQNTLPPPIFSEILLKSKKLVESWEGEIFFVYLPVERYFLNEKYQNFDIVKSIVENLEIEFIDVHEEAFKNLQNILSIFPLEMHNHYNENGYSIIGDLIAEKYNKTK